MEVSYPLGGSTFSTTGIVAEHAEGSRVPSLAALHERPKTEQLANPMIHSQYPDTGYLSYEVKR